MAELYKTRQQLKKVLASAEQPRGRHVSFASRQGMVRAPRGYSDMNPARPHTLDPVAPLSMVTGKSYSRQIRPKLPLDYNIIIDKTEREENPLITAAKARTAQHLAHLLERARPHRTDASMTYELTESGQASATGQRNRKTVEVADRGDALNTVEEICLNGLTFVISDFRGLDPADRQFVGVVAVKVNHPSERQLPYIPGGRVISFGHGYEVDLDDESDVAFQNERLQTRHDTVLSAYQSAGAATAEIITHHKLAEGYDVQEADVALAAALVSLQDKHKR